MHLCVNIWGSLLCLFSSRISGLVEEVAARLSAMCTGSRLRQMVPLWRVLQHWALQQTPLRYTPDYINEESPLPFTRLSLLICRTVECHLQTHWFLNPRVHPFKVHRVENCGSFLLLHLLLPRMSSSYSGLTSRWIIFNLALEKTIVCFLFYS